MIYLDSCILIYAMEDRGPRGDAVRAALRAVQSPVGSSDLALPDALHLAAAQLSGCDALWTNDKRLAAASRGLAVDVVNGS